jgi:dTDP-4-dehydrorhamnose reductase
MSNATILRTSWVYSVYGNNFVKTMLRLMSERSELSVVADQTGSPTWTDGLARLCWEVALRSDCAGTYHYSDVGQCSWYEFAVAIFEEALDLGLLTRDVVVKPIATTDYPTAATRPAFSVLDTGSCLREFGRPTVHWRDQLRNMLKICKEQSDA